MFTNTRENVTNIYGNYHGVVVVIIAMTIAIVRHTTYKHPHRVSRTANSNSGNIDRLLTNEARVLENLLKMKIVCVHFIFLIILREHISKFYMKFYPILKNKYDQFSCRTMNVKEKNV